MIKSGRLRINQLFCSTKLTYAGWRDTERKTEREREKEEKEGREKRERV